eukprot:scaffold42594_cov64-Phaeocystis_antarctica.AAC.4
MKLVTSARSVHSPRSVDISRVAASPGAWGGVPGQKGREHHSLPLFTMGGRRWGWPRCVHADCASSPRMQERLNVECMGTG